MSNDRLRTSLYIGSYFYLVLPYLVFFGGWVRQPYSTLLILVLLVGCVAGYRLILRAGRIEGLANASIPVSGIVLLLLPVLAVALIAGAGGWGYPNDDWDKHNSIFRDLVNESWPVIYDAGGVKTMLTYYTAHQLPAALAGKLFGWNIANHVLFVYTFLGLCLSALWVRLFTEIRLWWLFFAFILFSGMDVVGQLVSTVYAQPSMTAVIAALTDKVLVAQHLEWWIGWGFAQYSSMAALVFFVPNQATAGWLLTALIMSDAASGRLKQTAILYLGLCSLWAPFVAIGLLPLVLFLLVYEYRESGGGLIQSKQIFSWPNTAGLATGLMVTIYFVGRFQEFGMPVDLGNTIYDEKVTFTFYRSPDLFLPRYLLFIFLEFALLHGLLYIYLCNRKGPMFREQIWLLGFSTAFLLILPFLNWGWNNEPSMRSSIPALFITALIALRILVDSPERPAAIWTKRAILVVLLAGSLNATFEIGRQVTHIAHRGEIVSVPAQGEIDTIFEIQEEHYKNYHNFVGQYVGSPDSIFTRYFAKK